MRRKTAGCGSESLTACQVNTTRVAGRRIMRRKAAGPGSESLTACQVNTTSVKYHANKIKLGEMLQRPDIAGPAMKFLTFYPANRTRSKEKL